MKIKVWGARGSIPTPMSTRELQEKMIAVLERASGIDLSDPIAIRGFVAGLHPLVAGTAGGDTACVEVQTDNQLLILDAGTGIRALGQELMSGPCGQGQGEIHLLFSHTHWDHIQGLPFFIPAYVPGNKIKLYGIHPLQQPLSSQMQPATFPISLADLQADLEFIPLTEREPFTIGNIKINSMKLNHPGDAYAYRLEDQGNVFVYATDVECKKMDPASLQPLVSFFSGADAVIFDSQFTLRESLVKADWGHSSALVGAEIARRAKVKRLILFHHDPTTSDAELIEILQQARTYQTQFEAEPSTEILVGRESLTINLRPPQPFTVSHFANSETAIILITEEFNQAAAAQVIEQFNTQAENGQIPRLIVDLSDIKQLFISNLRALIDLRSTWKSRPMALASVSNQAQGIIELTNCLDLFSIFPSVKAANDALEAQEALRLPGQTIKDRYLIESKLRDSEIGTVFKAIDERLEREVALHVLSPTLNQTTVRRLLQQAQKLARLQHPGVVTLFDADEDRGLGFLVLEFSDALTLQGLIEANLTPSLLQIADGIAQALEYAHSKGAVHGNLRPNNILVGDQVKLIDFGLRLLEDTPGLADSPLLIEPSLYQAPEQQAGFPPTVQTDIFALGLILYQLATGQLAFEDQDFARAPAAPRHYNPQLSPSFEHCLLRMLAIEPEGRYQSLTQIRQVLANLNPNSAALPAKTQVVDTAPEATVPSMVTAPELIPQRKGRLIGREEQVQQILKLWSMASLGRGQIILVGGEAGIGKTRLAEEVIGHIEDSVALLGRCSEFEGNPPYQPFVEIGRQYVQQCSPAQFIEQVGPSQGSLSFAASLAPVLPAIYDLLPHVEPPPKLPPEQETARLQSSLVQFIERAASDRPWLIILDDLHWADPSSLQLLHYFARNVAEMPLLIVGTYRDVELEEKHPLRTLMTALSRLPIFHRLTLERLTQRQVAEMLAEIWQQEIPSDWVSAIYQRAGGNPFYIKEVTKTLVDEGVVTYDDGVWRFSRVVALKLPPKVRDIVARRINRINPDGRHLLSLAAVLGQQFNYGDLLAVSKLTEDQVLVSLDEALSHNLIREVDNGTTLAFSNVEIQQVIYEDLSQLRRRRLHQQIGHTLAEYYQNALDQAAGRLAYHFSQAQDTTNAFIYSLKAGQHAQTVFAFQTALHWYSKAADLLPQSASYDQDHITLYRGLGDMLQIQARYTEAIDAYCTMSMAAQAIDDTISQVEALYLSTSAQNSQGEYQIALEKAIETEAAARQAEIEDIAARAMYQQGWALLNLGQIAAARRVGEQLLTYSRTIEASFEMGQSLNLLAATHSAMGSYATAIEFQEQALQLYRQLGDRDRVGVMLNNLAEIYTMQADFTAAVTLYQEAITIARETGNRSSEILYLNNLSAAYNGLENYDAAEAQLIRVIQMPETIRSAYLSEIHRNMAETRLGQGKRAEAVAAAELSLALAQEMQSPEEIARAWRTLGLVSAQHTAPIMVAEKSHTSADCFAISLGTFKEIDMPAESARTLRVWSACENAQGNPAKAQQLIDDAEQILAALQAQDQ